MNLPCLILQLLALLASITKPVHGDIPGSTRLREALPSEEGWKGEGLHQEPAGNEGSTTRELQGSNRFWDRLEVVGGDGPRLVLEQKDGFGDQVWEVFGNEANFGILDRNSQQLVFRIRTGAPWNSILIDREGNVGMGLPPNAFGNPRARLDVRGGAIIDGDLSCPTTDLLQSRVDDLTARIAALEAALN